MDFRVARNVRLHECYALLVLEPLDEGREIPECRPGQFVQVEAHTPGVMLRRPISINRVDREGRQLWLLVRKAGRATARMVSLAEGERLNLLLPLGNGFTIPADGDVQKRLLLVGGGVGVAPLLQLGYELKERGYRPEFLLGARTDADLLELDLFESIGPVHISTDDGSRGTPGVVTLNPVLREEIDCIYCCGPAPMMKAVAAVARERGIDCEVSLENMMACGLGACLCCVEPTVKGNLCVCTEGPVFNINELLW